MKLQEDMSGSHKLAQERTSWGFLPLWVVSIIVGGGVFYLLVFPLFILSGSNRAVVMVVRICWGAVAGGIAGSLVGLGQWVPLQTLMPARGQWVRATALGWAMWGAVIIPVEDVFSEFYIVLQGRTVNFSTLIAGIAGAIAMGIGQWLSIHHWLPSKWIVATAIAWIMGWILMYIAFTITTVMFGAKERMDEIVLPLWILTAGTAGIITGAAMRYLTSERGKALPPAG